MRIRVLILVALAATGLVASSAAGHTPPVPGFPHEGSHTAGLPDLYADASNGAWLEHYDFGGAVGKRALLRFNGFIHNRVGAGTVELFGTDRLGAEMTDVRQRVYDADGTSRLLNNRGAQMVFEDSDTHLHWHLAEAARYSLWNAAGTMEQAASAKVGFCLTDTQYDRQDVPSEWDSGQHGDCGERAAVPREAAVAAMGITPGWRDVYWRNVHFQWVDVSQTLPGTYRLRSQVDPGNVIAEAGEPAAPAKPADEWVDSSVTIPGHIAQPVTAADLPRERASTITLRTQPFESTDVDQDKGSGVPAGKKPLGPAQFRIETPPADGTLNVPTDGKTWFSADEITYTPEPGADGSDAFTYSAREHDNPFPVAPARASVTVSLAAARPAEQVTISGAPASLLTGTGVQLTGTVVNPAGSDALTWAVDEVTGGSARTGTVTSTGLYQAPASVPDGGSVTVRATSASGTSGTAPIAIVAPPPRQPAPTVDPPPVADRANVLASPIVSPPSVGPALPGRTRTLSDVKVARKGRYVVVSFMPGRSGRARTTLLAGTRRMRSCVARVGAGRGYTCRLAVKGHPSVLKVSVALRRLDGRIVTWRSPRLAPAAPVHRH